MPFFFVFILRKTIQCEVQERGFDFQQLSLASCEVGCQIPADMRVVEMLGSQLRVDQAILTG